MAVNFENSPDFIFFPLYEKHKKHNVHSLHINALIDFPDSSQMLTVIKHCHVVT